MRVILPGRRLGRVLTVVPRRSSPDDQHLKLLCELGCRHVFATPPPCPSGGPEWRRADLQCAETRYLAPSAAKCSSLLRIQEFRSDGFGIFFGVRQRADVARPRAVPNSWHRSSTIQEQQPEIRLRRDGVLLHSAPPPPRTPGLAQRSGQTPGPDAEAAGPAIDGKRPPRDIERQQPEPVKCVCLNFLSVGTINHWHGSSCWLAAWCRWRRC